MNKAFTLIELIGVIVILSIISVLAYPSILKQINDTKNEISDAMKDIIYTAADLYASDYRLEKTDGKIYCIKLQDLINRDYLNDSLTDPVSNKQIDYDKFVEISVFSSNYNYKIVDQCTEN